MRMNYSAFESSLNTELEFDNFIFLAHAHDMHAPQITLFTITYGYQNAPNRILNIFITN